MSLAEYRTSTAVDIALVDPLAARLLALLEHFSGRVLVDSGRRSYGEQRVLWNRYLAGGNLAARPGTSNHERGLAADLRIVDPAVAWADVHAAAAGLGLWFPVPGEVWHIEAAPGWEPAVLEPARLHPKEPPEMVGLIHVPTPRPGAPAVVDFTWLPEDGRQWAGRVCSSVLAVRKGTGDAEVQVWFDGAERVIQVPADGRPLLVPVAAAGLCSVVGAGVVCEAREFWA